eukprot:UN24051
MSYQGVENDDQSKGWTYDEGLSMVGFGPFQYKLCVLTGAVWCADAMEIMLLSFLIPELEDDWDLTDAESGSIGSVVFMGALFGAFVFAYISDLKGRRSILIVSLMMLALFGVLTSFAQGLAWMLTFRFMVGFALGGYNF